MHQMPRQARSGIQAPFSGVLDPSFILQPTMTLENNMIFEDTGRQAWRSPSPLGQGGAPASQSNCSQPASSLQYLNALEEAWSEEQELSTTSHSIGLQESVGHLVLLIDSFNKGEPNNLQLSNVHVRDRACRPRTSLQHKKRGKTRRPRQSLQHNSLQAETKAETTAGRSA